MVETWKLLIGATGLVLILGVFVSQVGMPDSPATFAVFLIMAAVTAVVLVLSLRFGYRLGEGFAEPDDE